eukprot:11102411-Alexandrium_andersonii.AAC.1
MSASLVGSEMCIRDRRGHRPPATCAGEDCLPVGRGGRQGCQDDLAEPVSYTHLTLPTICSV